MIHPSYKELMNAVNSNSEDGEPIVRSRYSIVMGAAKRARQIVAANRLTYEGENQKALSIAVAELEKGEIHIVSEGSEAADIEARMPVIHTYENIFSSDDDPDENNESDAEYDSDRDDSEDDEDEEDKDERDQD